MDEKLNSRTVLVAVRPPPILILSHGVFTTPDLRVSIRSSPAGDEMDNDGELASTLMSYVGRGFPGCRYIADPTFLMSGNWDLPRMIDKAVTTRPDAEFASRSRS